MGCDIHGYVATVEPDRSRGSLIGLDGEPRDYRLFGYLAGVRHDVLPVVPPRGIPDWWDRVTEGIDFMEPRMGWDLGDHTRTWLTANELERALGMVEVETGGTRYYWRGVLSLMRGIEQEEGADGCDVFLVLGFDN